MTSERLHVLRIRTPEGVAFTVRLASPVLRAAAVILDFFVVVAAWSMIAKILSVARLIQEDIAGLMMTVGFFVLSEGYRIGAEWRWRGQTVGKRILRLRVVDARGLRLSFAQVVLRNLLRFVDVLPGCYLIGGVTALLNPRGQRLGDLAADTLVIWEPVEPRPDLEALRSEKYNSLRAHAGSVARLRQVISPPEARTLWSAVVRREEFAPEERVRLFADMAGHLRDRAAVPHELSEGVSDEQFVRNVVDVLFVSRSR